MDDDLQPTVSKDDPMFSVLDIEDSVSSSKLSRCSSTDSMEDSDSVTYKVSCIRDRKDNNKIARQFYGLSV